MARKNKTMNTRARGRWCRIAALAALPLWGGCSGPDPVAHAIQRLGGTHAEQQKAAMELRLTSRDPTPQLIATIENRKTKARVRVAAIEVLGDIARRQENEQAWAFLETLLTAPDENIREAAVKGFVDTEYDQAASALIALKAGAPETLRALIDKALGSMTRKMVREVEKQWNSPEAAMAAYQAAAGIGLGRGQMGYSHARFLEMRGRVEEANAKYDALGVIRKWWIIGPFPNRQGMGFRQVYPPENEVLLDAEYPSTLGPITWYRMDRPLPGGFLDFESFFVETDNVVGYTMVYLVSDREQQVEVRAGSDDTLQLYLNHELVWAHEEYRALNFDDDVVAITLNQGTNSLVFKVCEDWGGWQLMARITGPDDTPLEGVDIRL